MANSHELSFLILLFLDISFFTILINRVIHDWRVEHRKLVWNQNELAYLKLILLKLWVCADIILTDTKFNLSISLDLSL